LARYPRTVIVISHDRDLLDDAVDWIMHLEGGKLTLYRGGYTAFARQRAERMALDAKAAKKQELERKKLQAFIDRFKAKATKARQAQSRAKRLAKLEPIVAMANDEVRPIVFPPPAKPLSPPIVALEKVAVGYEPWQAGAAPPLAAHRSGRPHRAARARTATASRRSRKLLAQRLAPDSGIVTRAERMDGPYFAQHQLDELVPEQSVYPACRRLMPDAPEAKVRGARRQHRILRRARRHAGGKSVGRREGAAAARALRPSPDRISSSSTSRPTISTSTAAPRWSRRSTNFPAPRS
jgi:ATP-binding cassette subfamily F protein 3